MLNLEKGKALYAVLHAMIKYTYTCTHNEYAHIYV